jgi:hypothetical protein
MSKVRSGSDFVKSQVYKGITENGFGNMTDVEVDNESRKEVNMLKSQYIGMNLKMEG